MRERLAAPIGDLTVTIRRIGQAPQRLSGPNAIVFGMFTTLAGLFIGQAHAALRGAVGVGVASPVAGDNALTKATFLPATAHRTGVLCHIHFELGLEAANGQEITEYGLFAGDVLVARTVRSAIAKASDIALACDWQIDFSGGV